MAARSDIEADGASTDLDEKLSSPEAPAEIVIDWDGDDDPDNPLNWRRARKGVCLFIISLFTFCSPLSATYPAGVSPQLAVRYGIESPVVLALLTSSFCECSLRMAYAVLTVQASYNSHRFCHGTSV